MPRGKHLPANVRAEIMRRLFEGELPAIVGPQYGVTEKTCQKYLAEMRDDLRAKMGEKGCSSRAIEEEVHRIFRHNGCQFLAIEHPGEIKSCFVLATGAGDERRV